MLELLTDPAVWVGLATLGVLEIVLGVGNLIFLAIWRTSCRRTSATAPA